MNDQDTHDYYFDSPAARLVVLIIVCIGSFLTPLSLSATLVAIPAIARDLHADAVYVSWIPATFLLSNLVTLLPAGRLADIYGRKRIYLLGTIVFLLGSVLAALSTTIHTLLFFRAVQGIGAAMFFSTGMAIITSVFQNKGRGAALGWVVAAVYTGLTCGPFLGGWLTDVYGWRSVFLFQAPLALAGIILILLKMKGEWRSADALKVDYIGAAFLSIWLIALFIGVSKLPDWKAFVALVISAIFFYLFLRHTRRSPNAIIKLKVVWENRVFSHAMLASLFMYGGQYGLIFILGLYLQYNKGMSPTEAGRMIMLQAVIMAILAPMSGRLSDNYKPWLLAAAGCISASIGIALLLFVNVTDSFILLGISLLFLGVGFGLFSTPNNSAALGAVSKERLGMASALLTMARLMGQMLGTAIVTLLMSLMIGATKITPDQYDSLLSVFLWTTVISLFFSVTGIYYCFANRNVSSSSYKS